MNRERIAWTISLVLMVLLAFQIPGSLAQRDDDYRFIARLIEIQRQVGNHYVEEIDANSLREGAIDGLLKQLDPFSIYVPPQDHEMFDRMLEQRFRGVGIELNRLRDGSIEVVTPIENSPAFRAGVMAGDIILKVNGEEIHGMRLEEVIKRIGGPVDTEVTLTVRHLTGQEEDLTMTRQEIVVPTIKGYERDQKGNWNFYVADDPKIAYIRITQFTSETAEALRKAIEPLLNEGMKALILDVRFNPGGRLDQAVHVVNMFLDEGVILSTKGRNRPENKVMATSEGTLPKIPMVVLVNEHSASASEIVAGSLKDNRRALVIGDRTYGKGSVQEVIQLDAQGELKLTVAYYYLPSGQLVHRRDGAQEWGVEPNIKVPIDISLQERLVRERLAAEGFKRPVTATQPAPATAPATAPAIAPTTQPEVLDVQLQRAVDTLIGVLILQAEGGGEKTIVPPVMRDPRAMPFPEETPAPEKAPTEQSPAQEPPPEAQPDQDAPVREIPADQVTPELLSPTDEQSEKSVKESLERVAPVDKK